MPIIYYISLRHLLSLIEFMIQRWLGYIILAVWYTSKFMWLALGLDRLRILLIMRPITH